MFRNFPGGPVVKNLLSNAGDIGSIPGWGTKIPRASGQLSLSAGTTVPILCNKRKPSAAMRPNKAKKKKKKLIHLAKGERWYKCFGALPRIPGLQEVAQQPANRVHMTVLPAPCAPGSGSTCWELWSPVYPHLPFPR